MTILLSLLTIIIGVGFLIYFRKPIKTLASICDRRLKPYERRALAKDITLTHQFIEELVKSEGEHPLTPEEMLDLFFSGKGTLRIKRSDNKEEQQ